MAKKISRYEKLGTDLCEAMQKAREIAELTPDDGTCNFDTCMITLPRWNKEKILETMKSVGVRGYKSDFCRSSCYMIGNPIFAQASKNTIQSETICRILKEKGYDTSVFYWVD